MTAAPLSVPELDREPEMDEFLELVVEGLSRDQKTLPTQFLYDSRGSVLFDQICELAEYYPTRTELRIMSEHVAEMAQAVGSRVLLIEYGSGSGIKTRFLLEALEHPLAYVPVDISKDHLLRSVDVLQQRFEGLEILPVCADFTEPFVVPAPSAQRGRGVIYFPGSTIGNFTHDAALELLRLMRDEVGEGGAVLLGVDLRKDKSTLEAAYNDAKGVTAEFNLNLLARINRELEANFDLSAWRHHAPWDETNGRIEMRLVSMREQAVNIGGRTVRFAEGEWIRTEYSHKYTLEGFADLAKKAGLQVERVWTDERRLFSVQYLSVC